MKSYRSLSRIAFCGSLVFATILTACGSDAVSTDDCKVIAPAEPGVTELTITAKDMSFSESCVEVQPGTLAITFVNDDGRVAHNLRVDGGGINETTALESGPFTEVLTLELDTPGDYPFKCDPHANMKGVIVVAAPTTATD